MASNKEEVSTLLERVQKQGEAYKNGEQGSREALRDTVLQLQTAIIPPAENFILTTWAQPTHVAVLRFAGEIHLFEALTADNGSPKSSKAIADATKPKTEHTLVARMLRLLASMGSIKETDQDTFAPTAFSKAMAQENFQEAVEFMHDDFNPCLTKETAFFRGNEYKAPTSGLWAPFQYFMDCKGVDLFAYFAQDTTGMGKRFGNVMNVWSTDRPKWIQEGYYPVKERLIDGADGSETFLVDIAGGTGHDISQLKQAFGGQISGKLILQDRPEVIAVAEEDKSLEGIEKMAHDFLTEQPVKGARAYYLHSIMQDWNDETCKQILSSIKPAMTAGYSKILINDYIVPNKGAHWLQTSLDWELMAALGSRHRTRDELKALLEEIGLKMVDVFQHPQSVDVVVEVELA